MKNDDRNYNLDLSRFNYGKEKTYVTIILM